MSSDLHRSMQELHRALRAAQYRKEHPRMSKLWTALGALIGSIGCLGYIAVALFGAAVPFLVGFAALRYLGWI